MTDMEMDLVLAKAEILSLQKTIRKQEDMLANYKTHIFALQQTIENLRKLNSQKCSFGEGITIKPDGINELDPCIYEVKEIHANVTVYVRKCKKCGNIDISWERQEDTEDILEDGDLDG